MAVIGYIRVSTEKQDYDTQKLAILDYCQKSKLVVDEWKEIKVSSRKSRIYLKERIHGVTMALFF